VKENPAAPGGGPGPARLRWLLGSGRAQPWPTAWPCSSVTVERAVEDVEQLGGIVVPVRYRAIGAATERDTVAAHRARGGAAIGQQHVPDEVEVFGLVGAH
jgi:hypothetical protein